MMRTLELVPLTIRELVKGREIINISGSHIVLQLTEVIRGLLMRKSQVGKRLSFLSSVSSVASWATVLMNA